MVFFLNFWIIWIYLRFVVSTLDLEATMQELTEENLRFQEKQRKLQLTSKIIPVYVKDFPNITELHVLSLDLRSLREKVASQLGCSQQAFVIRLEMGTSKSTFLCLFLICAIWTLDEKKFIKLNKDLEEDPEKLEAVLSQTKAVHVSAVAIKIGTSRSFLVVESWYLTYSTL